RSRITRRAQRNSSCTLMCRDRMVQQINCVPAGTVPVKAEKVRYSCGLTNNYRPARAAWLTWKNSRMKMKLLAAIAFAAFACTSASAQNFPERPMTMVIPFAAGGPTDVHGRVESTGGRDWHRPSKTGHKVAGGGPAWDAVR